MNEPSIFWHVHVRKSAALEMLSCKRPLPRCPAEASAALIASMGVPYTGEITRNKSFLPPPPLGHNLPLPPLTFPVIIIHSNASVHYYVAPSSVTLLELEQCNAS